MEIIRITIDYETIWRYEKYYRRKYPRRKKRPIEHPYPDSMNSWMVMKRQEMNSLKQAWKEFICWVIAENGLTGKQIDKCEIRQKIYFPTARRNDLDNYTPKFILDGFVESGFIVDDDYKHITKLVFQADRDKERPRTEYTVKILDEEK